MNEKKFRVVERTGPHTHRVLCSSNSLAELMVEIEASVIAECVAKHEAAKQAIYNEILGADITYQSKPLRIAEEMLLHHLIFAPALSPMGEGAPPLPDPDDDVDDGSDDPDATPIVVTTPDKN